MTKMVYSIKFSSIIHFSLLCFLLIAGNARSAPGPVQNDSIPTLIPHADPTILRKPVLQWYKLNIPVTKYFIQIANDATFKFPLINVSVADTLYTSDIDLPLGMIYWRVSIDLTKWSEPNSFTIIDGRIPSLLPHESPTVVRKPTLLWHTPPIAVTSFTIQIGTDSAFASIIKSDTSFDTSYTCDTLLPLGMIYWRVQSDSSAFSETNSFLIKDGRIPTLISYDSITFERKPTLSWFKPPLEVTSFNIQVAKDSKFVIDSLIVNDFTADTFYTCKADLSIGPIFWRIKSDDADFSEIDSFEIKDARIPLLYPIEPDLINSTQPVLSWRSVTGAQSYTIEIDNNSDFSSTIIALPVSDTMYTHFEQLPFGNIYWRVKSDQVDTWSDIDHFYIITDTIPLIDRFNGKVLLEKRPSFIWHPVEKADKYQIKLATNKNFTGAITVPLEDTTYTSTTDLAYSKWYWKVSCSRNLDVYCPIDSFIIDSSTTINQNNFKSIGDITLQRYKDFIKILKNQNFKKNISLTVFDMRGRIVTSLLQQSNTSKELIWDYKDRHGNRVPPGMYVISLHTGRNRVSHKILISR